MFKYLVTMMVLAIPTFSATVEKKDMYQFRLECGTGGTPEKPSPRTSPKRPATPPAKK